MTFNIPSLQKDKKEQYHLPAKLWIDSLIYFKIRIYYFQF